MERILIVEDNYENYYLITEILDRYEIELIRASDGKDFFEILQKDKDFNLVLMDFMLPDTDGIELTKYLIDNHFKFPIVFISAYNERCEEIYDLGVEYFLQKPVMTELFLSVIGKIIKLEQKPLHS